MLLLQLLWIKMLPQNLEEKALSMIHERALCNAGSLITVSLNWNNRFLYHHIDALFSPVWGSR
jgi:hypothetical protein